MELNEFLNNSTFKKILGRKYSGDEGKEETHFPAFPAFHLRESWHKGLTQWVFTEGWEPDTFFPLLGVKIVSWGLRKGTLLILKLEK